ncbi:MAG: ribbon-helix-helix protein, CopG family [bacterium]|nr:ribbon-helix-helix protein, CopG family [bacterium]
MTMLSFHASDEEAWQVQRWAYRLGTTRSEVIRESLRRHLAWLASVEDADRWEKLPLAVDKLTIGRIADWGVTEDWSDWANATL